MTQKQIIKWLNHAKKFSLMSDFGRVKLGAVIIYKGRIVSYGYNTTKGNPIQYRYNKYNNMYYWAAMQHAEIMALNKIKFSNYNKKKLSIFVFRQYKNGDWAIAKPCKACERAIKDFGIENVYYTRNKGYVYEHYLEV